MGAESKASRVPTAQAFHTRQHAQQGGMVFVHATLVAHLHSPAVWNLLHEVE